MTSRQVCVRDTRSSRPFWRHPDSVLRLILARIATAPAPGQRHHETRETRKAEPDPMWKGTVEFSSRYGIPNTDTIPFVTGFGKSVKIDSVTDSGESLICLQQLS